MNIPSCKQAEEAISILLTFLTHCGPENPDLDRIVKEVETVVNWHQEYAAWKKKCRIKERFSKFIDEKR